MAVGNLKEDGDCNKGGCLEGKKDWWATGDREGLLFVL
jgi:hypothetical protein